MQIRTRLTLQFVLIVASILFVAMLYTYLQFRTHLQNEFYGNLQSKINLVAGVAIGRLEREGPQEIRNAAAGFVNFSENLAVYNDRNELVYSFNPLPKTTPPNTLEEVRNVGECRFVNDRFFALGKRFAAPSGKGYVVVAEAVFKPKELADLTRILLIVFGLSVALVAAGGWIFAGRALAPVSHIMNQVDALLPGDLGKRLETSNNHDELARLVFTFNKLLERIHRAFNSQKMFLSNVSHELKNPLTVIISQIEIALQKERDGEEYRQILQSVLEDARDINLMSDKLMQLAKINAGGEAIPMEPLRIDEVVWQAKEAVLKSNPDYCVHFEIRNLPDEEAKLSIRGNEQLLKTALINLMDNGCKFSADHRVNVQLSFDDSGKTAVEIRDEGAGIAAEDLPALFEPFYRSRHNGSIKGNGIGLSLVDSIVKLHRIDLKVERNQPQGAVFRMEFSGGTK